MRKLLRTEKDRKNRKLAVIIVFDEIEILNHSDKKK
jgi:hypothetical protein